jgi:hypothetical protein
MKPVQIERESSTLGAFFYVQAGEHHPGFAGLE